MDLKILDAIIGKSLSKISQIQEGGSLRIEK